MVELKRKKYFRLLGYPALTCFSFIITALGIHLLLEFNHLGAGCILEKKINHIEKNPGKYDVIFVGSSYIYRNIKPLVFCSHLKSLGIELTAYSLSAPGSYAFEVNHYLNILLDLDEMKRPRYVLINLFDVTPEYVLSVMDENKFINRMNRYHDFNTTYLNIRTILLTDWSYYKKASTIVDHILHFLCNITNINRGVYLIGRHDLKSWEERIIVDQNGYEHNLTGKRLHSEDFTREKYEDMLKIHQKYLDAFLNGGIEVEPHAADVFFRRVQFKKIEEFGIRVIYVVPPVPYDLRNVYALTETDGFPATFFMDNVYRYPEIFEYENRYDKGHLNDRGADYYSKYLAERFLEFLRTCK